MREHINDLQAAALSRAATAGEAAAPAAVQGLFGPSDGSRWSDALREDGIVDEQVASRGVVTTSGAAAQTDSDGFDATARKVDEALNEVIKVSASRRDSIDVLTRRLSLAAADVLTALGYRHAGAAAADSDSQEGHDGLDDVRGASCTGGELDACGHSEDTAAPAAAPREVRYNGISYATAMEDVTDKPPGADGADERHAEEADDEGATVHSAPGAYVHDAPRGAARPRFDDEFERLIAEVQAEDERHSASAGWPLSMPASWYTQDPKRAARVLFRHAYGREPSQHEVDFYSVLLRLPSRSGQAARTGHRATARFPCWHHGLRVLPALWPRPSVRRFGTRLISIVTGFSGMRVTAARRDDRQFALE